MNLDTNRNVNPEVEPDVPPEQAKLVIKLEKDTPELTANWFSFYTLNWIGKFLNLGSKIQVRSSIYPLPLSLGI